MSWLSVIFFLIKWGPTIFQLIKSLPGMIKLVRDLFGAMNGLSHANRVLMTKKLEVIFAEAKATDGVTVSIDSLNTFIEPKLNRWREQVARLHHGMAKN